MDLAKIKRRIEIADRQKQTQLELTEYAALVQGSLWDEAKFLLSLVKRQEAAIVMLREQRLEATKMNYAGRGYIFDDQNRLAERDCNNLDFYIDNILKG